MTLTKWALVCAMVCYLGVSRAERLFWRVAPLPRAWRLASNRLMLWLNRPIEGAARRMGYVRGNP